MSQRRWPVYEQLCDIADVRELRIGLAVTAAKVLAGQRVSEPMVASIEISDPTSGMRPLAAPVYNDELDAAASELLARLA